MNRGPLLGFALLMAVVALVITGCGSSSKSKTHVASKADFAKAMNSLCDKAGASTSALGSAQSMADVANAGPGYVTAMTDLLDRLKKLEPSAEIKPQVNDYLSNAQKMLSLLNSLVAAAKKNDSVAFVKITSTAGPQFQTALTAIKADEQAIGATSCITEGF